MSENAAYFGPVPFLLDHFSLYIGKRAEFKTESGRTITLFYGLEKAWRLLHNAINILQATVLQIRDVFRPFLKTMTGSLE
jgi:hypothetical protein